MIHSESTLLPLQLSPRSQVARAVKEKKIKGTESL